MRPSPGIYLMTRTVRGVYTLVSRVRCHRLPHPPSRVLSFLSVQGGDQVRRGRDSHQSHQHHRGRVDHDDGPRLRRPCRAAIPAAGPLRAVPAPGCRRDALPPLRGVSSRPPWAWWRSAIVQVAEKGVDEIDERARGGALGSQGRGHRPQKPSLPADQGVHGRKLGAHVHDAGRPSRKRLARLRGQGNLRVRPS